MHRRLSALLLFQAENDANALASALRSAVRFKVDTEIFLNGNYSNIKVQEGMWDVVFCDCDLGRDVVFDISRRFKKEKPLTPLIALASADTEELAVRTMNIGARDYLLKGSWTKLGALMRRELSASEIHETEAGDIGGRRTTALLRAVRNINRAVLRGDDPLTSVASICQELVSIGSLKTAWVYLNHDVPGLQRTVSCGRQCSLDLFFDRMDNQWLPRCCERAIAENSIVRTHFPLSTCDACSLLDNCRTDANHPDEVFTTAIRFEKRIYGFMCVSMAADFGSEEEKGFLLKEMADDIAFAVRSIELAKEREKMESDLHREAKRRQILMGASRDGICIINQKHEIVEANQRFAEMLGYTPEEVLSLHTWDFEANMKEAEIRVAFADLTQTSATFETRHRRKDGTFYDVEVSASGTLVGDEPMVFTVSRDITEKRNVQASLAQSDRLVSMGVLAAGVAHEINNPLAYVLYNLESLTGDVEALVSELRQSQYNSDVQPEASYDCSDGDPTSRCREAQFLNDVEERFQEALTGVRRIQAITRSLGTFARVEPEHQVPVNLQYVIECAINMAFNEIRYRARLVKDFSPLPVMLASEGGISQVFLNLLINAAHAIGEGAADKNEIRIRTWREEGEACVEVRDTGEGILEENLERIFEPFFTTKSVGVGSGLGLAISRNIIRAHGGRIEVNSDIGKGTRFLIRLPIRRPLSENARLEMAKRVGVETFGRVLIVDDEEGICRAVKRILEGHDVTVAKNGQGAKMIIQDDQSFDVILCDMMMPGMSGMELHAWLAETYPALAEQFVFVTGGAFTPNSQQYLRKYDIACVNKPFDMVELKKLVSERVLASSRQH